MPSALERANVKDYRKKKTPRGTGLTCLRSDCGGKFIINYERVVAVKAERHISTIVCPYCSRVSHIPKEDRTEAHGAAPFTDGYGGK